MVLDEATKVCLSQEQYNDGNNKERTLEQYDFISPFDGNLTAEPLTFAHQKNPTTNRIPRGASPVITCKVPSVYRGYYPPGATFLGPASLSRAPIPTPSPSRARSWTRTSTH